MVRQSTRQNRARLSLTGLEDRSVPAGDVLAQVSGGTLQITGDDFDNEFLVVGGFDGAATVTGFGDTSVNGIIGGGDLFTGVDRVVILTGDGDDSLHCIWSWLDATIDTGHGNDRVTVQSLFMTGDLVVSTGDGSDEIQFVSTSHTGSVRIDAGNGSDLVQVALNWLDGDLAIGAGNGNDAVVVYVPLSERVGYVTGNLSIDGGNGKSDTLFGLNSPRWLIVVEGELSISGIEEVT